MKRKTIFGIISGVLLTGVVAASCFLFFRFLNRDKNDGNGSDSLTLKTPTNLSFDDSKYLLTWSIPEKADSFKVKINDSTVVDLTTNSYKYVPTSETTTFSVQACDSTGTYYGSNWTDKITYTVNMQDDKITEARINVFADSLDQFANLKYVVSMYMYDGKMYVQAVYKDNGKDVLKNIRVKYNTTVTTLKDAIDISKIERAKEMDSYKISNYKSLESLLKSDSFDGKMEELNQAGYEFSIVTSQTVENSDCSDVKENPSIFAVIRAEKNGDVKYFQTRIDCRATNPTPSQEANYEFKLENASDRLITEVSFHELTGDLYDYYDALYKSKSE